MRLTSRPRGAFSLAWNSAPLDLQRATIRVTAQLATALDQRRVQRGRADQRVRVACLQSPIERFELIQDAPHAHDGVATITGPAAVRRAAFGLDLDPLEALVRDGHVQIRGLGDDGRRRPASCVTSASAPMLACSSSTTQATIRRPASSPPDSAIVGRRRSWRRRRSSCPATPRP